MFLIAKQLACIYTGLPSQCECSLLLVIIWDIPVLLFYFDTIQKPYGTHQKKEIDIRHARFGSTTCIAIWIEEETREYPQIMWYRISFQA